MINIQDNIDLQIAFNRRHHKLKRHVLRTVYRAYNAAGSELLQTLTDPDNVLEENILDHYLALGNHVQIHETGKFLNTLIILGPIIKEFDTLKIPDRSKNDCKQAIYTTLCSYFGLSLPN